VQGGIIDPRVRIRAVVALACLTMVAVALVAGLAAAAAARAAYPPYPSKLIVKSEMRLKADLIRRNLKRSPQLVFFGGSRSQRFDPAFAKKRTGLRAVNIANSCARPEAAWGYLNWFYKRWPDADIRWVWGMQSGMLRDLDLDPALLQDKRFYPYFPDDLLASQRAKLPRSVAKMPRSYGFLRNRYSSRGLLIWNRYDRRRAAGYPLRKALDAYIARMLHTDGRASVSDTRARGYFEDTIRLLNEHGTTPVIVIMPVHPRVLRVMKAHGMGGERQSLREYLAELGDTLDIKVLDFTTIKSFNGKADWFYDGVHITRRNTNRVINAVKAQAGDCLK
jgi:hypothetical protein